MNESCMENCPVLPRVEALERVNDKHSAAHREIFSRIGALETATAVQDTKLDTIEDKLDELTSMVKELSEKPGKRWETLVACAISSLGTAFVMWLAMGMPGLAG